MSCSRDSSAVNAAIPGLIKARGYLYADPKREAEFRKANPELYEDKEEVE